MCKTVITTLPFPLGCLPNLSMLQMTHNHLTTRSDVEHLADCSKLSSVDLSHNRIADESVVEVFPKMKALRVLVLTGEWGRTPIKLSIVQSSR